MATQADLDRALTWARAQVGKPYQLGTFGSTFDCSTYMSGIATMIRDGVARKWFTTHPFHGGAFSPLPGWERGLEAPFMIGIQDSGVGHTGGTLLGIHFEATAADERRVRSSEVDSRTRGAKHPYYDRFYGFRPSLLGGVGTPQPTPPPVSGGTVSLSNLKYGLRNDDVKTFQKALIAKGESIPAGATGYYGDQTKAACASFQRKQGWTGSAADGFPGPLTLQRLGLTQKGAPVVAARVASPVPGYKVTYPYGVRNTRYAAGYHTGDDYAAPAGTKVVAVRSGTIAWSNSRGGAYGNWIGLRADNGRDYVYCHLSSRAVSAGTKVKAGQALGKVGSTGNVTGPHLHFEDRPQGGGYGQVRKPSW